MERKVYSDLSHIPAEYERLFHESNVEGFFHSRHWLKNFVTNAADRADRMRFYCIADNRCQGVPRGFLAMRFREQPSRWGRPLMLRGLSNFYTPLFGPIVDKSYTDSSEIVRALVQAVCSDIHRWDAVDLSPLCTEVSTFLELCDAFREAGWVVQRYFCFGNWFLTVDGRSYKTYFDGLPSAMRNTINRKRKKALLRGLRLEVLTGGKNLDHGIEAFQKVYAASWKRPEPYVGFMPGLIRACADQGVLRLGIAYFGGQPAAAQVWIVAHGIASIYKLAYEEQYSEFSIGSILTAYLMEHVIEVDKVHTVDYLVGDDDYKKSWMSQRRERWGIRAFNPKTIRGIVEISRHVGGKVLKSFWQRLLNLTVTISRRAS